MEKGVSGALAKAGEVFLGVSKGSVGRHGPSTRNNMLWSFTGMISGKDCCIVCF